VRTTVTLDDDVIAMIEAERARTGESFRSVVNRLLRRGGHPDRATSARPLPELPGGPVVDLSDISAVLAALDDERSAARSLP
jgi:hypothetical protein